MDRETKIIYLTAYRDYAAGAFGVHAFQYLLKPVNKGGLWKVLDEVFRYIGSPRRKAVLDFHTAEGMVCLAAEEIYFFEYIGRKIRIVADKEYFMAGRIGRVYERVQPLGFSMPHKSFVVNMIHVKNVKNQQIYMDNGMEVPLSQKKMKSWKEELTVYLAERLAEEVGK